MVRPSPDGKNETRTNMTTQTQQTDQTPHLDAILGTGAPPVTVDDAVARIAASDALAAKLGVPRGDGTLYAVGTRLAASGQAAARQYRDAFDALPTAREGLRGLIDQIKAERRNDLTARVADLRVSPEGRVGRAGKDGLPLTAEALAGLCSRVTAPPHAAGYLAAIPADRRAAELRAILAGSNPDKELTFRARKLASGWQAYAVVSPTYQAYDPDALAGDLLGSGLDGARAAITYDGIRTKIDLHAATTVAPADQRVGDAFRAISRLTTRDDGGGSVRGMGLAEFVRCVNYSVIRQGVGLGRVAHRGDVARLVGDLTGTAGAWLGEWLKLWHRAEQAELGGWTAVDALEALALARVISVQNEEPASVARKVVEAASDERDRGDTIGGLHASITRAAHTAAWGSPLAAAERLEGQAGLLLEMDPARLLAAVAEATRIEEDRLGGPALSYILAAERRAGLN